VVDKRGLILSKIKNSINGVVLIPARKDRSSNVRKNEEIIIFKMRKQYHQTTADHSTLRGPRIDRKYDEDIIIIYAPA